MIRAGEGRGVFKIFALNKNSLIKQHIILTNSVALIAFSSLQYHDIEYAHFGIFMFNAFLRSFSWFFGHSEEEQITVFSESKGKKRPYAVLNEQEKPKYKHKKTKKAAVIDLSVDDSSEEVDATTASSTLELICNTRKGLSFSCATSSLIHEHNLAKLKAKYSSDSVLQSFSTRVEACLRFKEEDIEPEELWLSSIIIRKFSQELEKIHPNFKFIDYGQAIIPFLQDLQSEPEAQEEEQDEGFVQIPFKQILKKATEQLKAKTHIAISVNDGSHYYTLLVDLTDIECIKIYGSDSLDMLRHHTEYFQNASTYFSVLYPEAIIAYEAFKIPNQQNTYDCGVSLCALMEKHARGEFKPDMLQAFSKQEVFNYGAYRQHIAEVLAMDEPEPERERNTKSNKHKKRRAKSRVNK